MVTDSDTRVAMTLYSHETDPYCHLCRIVLAEKDVAANIIQIDLNHKPEDLADLNPYHQVPTLVDRDLVLYESRIILEYLDERYPHPPLLPVYPAEKARSRLILHRIDRDWYRLLLKILHTSDPGVQSQVRKDLTDSLTSFAVAFPKTPYFCGDEYSLVDSSMSALLWRLGYYDIKLPTQAQAMINYAKRLFNRSAFQASLTDAERVLGEKNCI